MALVINNEPGNDVSVNNEMIFTVYEATKANDETTYPDYSYVCDVYVDGTFAARLKSRPDPLYKRGVFDVSKILQGYVTYGLKANYSNATETYTASVSYTLKFGEEYNFVLYTNLLVDSSTRTALKSYQFKPFDTTDVLDIQDQFCTNSPDTIYSFKEIKWHLVPFFDNVTGVGSFSCKFYDSSGTQVGSTVSISTSGYAANTYLQINVGFQKIASALTTAEKNSVEYMVLQGTDPTTTNDFQKRIDYICSKHSPFVISWLNQLGAYESYPFGMVSKKTNEIARKEFQKLSYQMNASGVISYSADGVYYGGKRGYATDTKVSMQMTSHILTDDEYQWLQEIFSSPDVYMYDSVSDKFMPVSVKESNYELRTYGNSRLTPLQFSVQFSDSFNAQFL